LDVFLHLGKAPVHLVLQILQAIQGRLVFGFGPAQLAEFGFDAVESVVHLVPQRSKR